MFKIDELDKNFKTEAVVGQSDVRFFDANEAPFSVHGVFYEDGAYRRLPEQVAAAVSDNVHRLSTNTAGGRIRFRTNSPFVALRAEMPAVGKMPNFALAGSAGFDLYADNRYYATFVPPLTIKDGYESVHSFPDTALREITIHFPLYSDVSRLYIGISRDAALLPPTPYKTEAPIVFYGSSITQGGTASHAGNAYQNILSRRLDADHVNLGFSGSARAEEAIAAYIAAMHMSVFVYDYDHNAPDIAHLTATHQRMFQTVRNAQPQLPIVILSRPKYTLTAEETARLAVIRETYTAAVAAGDRRVELLDGRQLMQLAEDDGTVDAVHPNDLGFFSMAQALLPVLEKYL